MHLLDLERLVAASRGETPYGFRSLPGKKDSIGPNIRVSLRFEEFCTLLTAVRESDAGLPDKWNPHGRPSAARAAAVAAVADSSFEGADDFEV